MDSDDEKDFIVVNMEDDDIETKYHNLDLKYRKLRSEKLILEKRHNELLKLMGDLLKLPKNNSLEDIHNHIFQIYYNEIRRHAIIPFSTILGNYPTHKHVIEDNLD